MRVCQVLGQSDDYCVDQFDGQLEEALGVVWRENLEKECQSDLHCYSTETKEVVISCPNHIMIF